MEYITSNEGADSREIHSEILMPKFSIKYCQYRIDEEIKVSTYPQKFRSVYASDIRLNIGGNISGVSSLKATRRMETRR